MMKFPLLSPRPADPAATGSGSAAIGSGSAATGSGSAAIGSGPVAIGPGAAGVARSRRPGGPPLAAAAALVTLVALTAGCPPTSGLPDRVGSLPAGGSSESAANPPQDRLKATIGKALADGYHGRQLSTDRNGAWQILHGVLAYGPAFLVETPEGTVPAMQYAMEGGRIDGFDPLLGDRFTDPVGRGVRVELDPGTKIGQGHRDQWLAILSQCDLPAEAPLQVQGERRQIIDLVRQTEWDIPLNLEREYSWTLIGLTAYRPTSHFWTARDGRMWTIEQLVASELERDLRSSACGGTHRIIGLAMALDRHRQQGGRLTGAWGDAARRIEEVVAAARLHQNGDGSFSSVYFHRPGWTPDLADVLSTSGHTLEMLAIAADDATLAEPWVERAALRLCEVLDLTADVELECGALYHALHGLVVYHQRRFGTWDASSRQARGQARASSAISDVALTPTPRSTPPWRSDKPRRR